MILTVNHQQVQIEAYTPLPGKSAPALHIAVSDPDVAAPGDSSTAALESTPSPDDASDNNPAGRTAGTLHAGFTHEEELFRTKWGWAAYDAVRRAAMESAPSPP